jgi:hypothetical protein
MSPLIIGGTFLAASVDFVAVVFFPSTIGSLLY